MTRLAIDGDTLTLFFELNACSVSGGGLATVTFGGVTNVAEIRAELGAGPRLPACPHSIAGVVGIVFEPTKPADARHSVIVDLCPAPVLRVRCRSVHEQ